MTFAAFALGAFVLALGSACEALRAEDLGPTVELKPGQEIAFPVAIVDGRVMLGKPRLLRPGAAQPKDGEIAVNVVKQDASPYADLTASAKLRPQLISSRPASSATSKSTKSSFAGASTRRLRRTSIRAHGAFP